MQIKYVVYVQYTLTPPTDRLLKLYGVPGVENKNMCQHH